MRQDGFDPAGRASGAGVYLTGAALVLAATAAAAGLGGCGSGNNAPGTPTPKGVGHTCVVGAAGVVRCWGRDDSGQLGTGAEYFGDGGVAATVVLGLTGVLDVRMGFAQTCALMADATVQCWGIDTNGQLGGVFLNPDGTLGRPVPGVVPGVVQAQGIAVGLDHACAWVQAGNATCWGGNAFGQVGDGTTVDRYGRVTVGAPALTNVTLMAAGGWHTCAVHGAGKVACWGANAFGQLGLGATGTNGDGGVNADQYTPVNIPGLTGVAELALGNWHTCARMTDGTVQCWGRDDSGQLGDAQSGAGVLRATPALVPNLAGVTKLGLGVCHSCVLGAGGTVSCWGCNDHGQLGTGAIDTTAHGTPAPVQGISNATDLVVGGWHTCARFADGSTQCWGADTSGQLGDGLATDRPTPMVVPNAM